MFSQSVDLKILTDRLLYNFLECPLRVLAELARVRVVAVWHRDDLWALIMLPNCAHALFGSRVESKQRYE